MISRRVKKKKRWALIKFGLSIYLIAGMFALVGLRNAVVNLEYDIAGLNKERVSLIRTNKSLTARRAGFYSAKMIEDIATRKLGMSLPERENVFFVRKEAGASMYKVSMAGSRKSKSLWE